MSVVCPYTRQSHYSKSIEEQITLDAKESATPFVSVSRLNVATKCKAIDEYSYTFH
ncbi:hypothetical protein NTGM5_150038 [Candidatus Nitrotoga sp. M5]|nr:hypothetical protein NTGM5_150038 [Candidatus Nitrotoga sp. M5]